MRSKRFVVLWTIAMLVSGFYLGFQYMQSKIGFQICYEKTKSLSERTIRGEKDTRSLVLPLDPDSSKQVKEPMVPRASTDFEMIQSLSYLNKSGKRVKSDKAGVLVNIKEKAFDGVTLYTSEDEDAARLIDMDGKLLHEWRFPRKNIRSGAEIKKKMYKSINGFRTAYLEENLDLF